MKNMKLKSKIISLFLSILVVYVAIVAIGYKYTINLSVENSISHFGMNTNEYIVNQFNADEYEQWLENPVENDLYWKLRENLNEIKEHNGAMYLYTLQADEKNEELFIMVDGMTKEAESAAPIHEPTTATAFEDIRDVLKGKAVSTDLVEDKEYGNYVSSFSPIKDSKGNIIGILGMDIDANSVSSITEQVSKELMPKIITISLVFIALVGFIVFVVIQRLLKPLSTIQESAKLITEGDISGDKITYTNNDEIGAIVESFNLMQEELRKVISEVQQTSSEVEQRNNELLNNSVKLMEQSNDVEAASHSIVDKNTNINLSMDSVQNTMVQLDTSIERVSSSVEVLHNLTKEVYEEGNESQIILVETAKQNKMTRQLFKEFSSTMESLVEKSSHMEQIIDTIDNVASQTNLLALNAAIEAARAGESGKGFAVVAEEVRKLAELTTQYTKEINEKISDIQNDTFNAKEKLTKTVQQYDVQSLKVDEASSNMMKLKTITDNLYQSLDKVTDSLNAMVLHQKTINEEVTVALADTTDTANATEEVNASITEIKDNIQKFVDDLNENNKEIKELVKNTHKFTL